MTRGRRGAERSDCDNACGFWNGAWDPHVRGECSKAFASCDMCLSVLAQVKLSPRTGPVFVRFSLCLVILLSPLQPLLPPCPATLMELAKLDDMTKRGETPAGETESSPGKTATYDFCTGATHACGEAEGHLCLSHDRQRAGEIEGSPGKTAIYDFCAGATHAHGEELDGETLVQLCLMEKSHLISLGRFNSFQHICTMQFQLYSHSQTFLHPSRAQTYIA